MNMFGGLTAKGGPRFPEWFYTRLYGSKKPHPADALPVADVVPPNIVHSLDALLWADLIEEMNARPLVTPRDWRQFIDSLALRPSDNMFESHRRLHAPYISKD